MGRRGFVRRMGEWSFLSASLLAGCGRVGLAPPSEEELPSPEAQGRLSVSPESLYWAHGEPGAWFNPWWRRPGSFGNLFRWKLLYRNSYLEARKRPPEVPVVPNDGAYLSRPEASASVTWVGHCTFIVKDGPDTWLTDPHFGPRSLLPGRQVPLGVPLEKVPEDAFAVVSHNHYDHLDACTVERLPRGIAWFVPLGLGEWFRERGHERVTELDWWGTARHGRWRLTCLPSQHWSRRVWVARNATLWCGWMLESGDRRFYYAGDTGYFHGFAEFARRFGPIDVAMLPIGAYAPRWMMRYPHLNPAEAYLAFRELRARWMIPMHWGTFDLTNEPIDEPPRALRRAVRAARGDMDAVRVMAIGERWRLA